MSDLEWTTPPPDPTRPTQPKRCRRHEWLSIRETTGSPIAPSIVRCVRCPAIRDEEKAKRGKSSRRLGGDQERRIERVYGPTKIGERGDPVDHLGLVWKWQSKATRSLPPKWLAAITGIAWRPTVSKAIEDAVARMAGLYEPRGSLLIRSFIRAGVKPRDWIFVPGEYWTQLYGPEFPNGGWFVMTGPTFLDIHGRDGEGDAK